MATTTIPTTITIGSKTYQTTDSKGANYLDPNLNWIQDLSNGQWVQSQNSSLPGYMTPFNYNYTVKYNTQVQQQQQAQQAAATAANAFDPASLGTITTQVAPITASNGVTYYPTQQGWVQTQYSTNKNYVDPAQLSNLQQQQTKAAQVYVDPTAYVNTSNLDPSILNQYGITGTQVQTVNPNAPNYVSLGILTSAQNANTQLQQLNSAESAFTLPEIGATSQTITSPKGTQYVSVPADPISGTPAQWFQVGPNYTYTPVSAPNQPLSSQGPIAPQQFNQMINTVNQDIQTKKYNDYVASIPTTTVSYQQMTANGPVTVTNNYQTQDPTLNNYISPSDLLYSQQQAQSISAATAAAVEQQKAQAAQLAQQQQQAKQHQIESVVTGIDTYGPGYAASLGIPGYSNQGGGIGPQAVVNFDTTTKILKDSYPVYDATNNVVWYPTANGWQQNLKSDVAGYNTNIQMQMPEVNGISHAFVSPTGIIWYPSAPTVNPDGSLTVSSGAGWYQGTNPNAPGYVKDAETIYNSQTFQTNTDVSNARASYVNPNDYVAVPSDINPTLMPAGVKPTTINGQQVVQSVNPYGAGYVTQDQLASLNQAQQQSQTLKKQEELANPSNTLGGLGNLLAGFDNFINKTVGWDNIAAVAGSLVGGPLGAALAKGTAEAVQGKTPGQILRDAAITFAAAYGTQALTEALGSSVDTAIQQGVSNGTIDPISVDQASTESFGTPDYTEVTNAGPVQPGEAVTPVSEGPQLPVQPTAPTDLTSTGVSDMPAGTTFEGPNGTEVVLDSGKTVNLAEYNAAVDSGQPISVDGQMTAGYQGSVQVLPAPESPIAPGTGPAPDYSNFNVDSSGDIIDKVTGENYGPASDNGFTPTSDGSYTAPDGSVLQPTGSNIPSSVVIGGTTAAALAATVASSGGATSAVTAPVATTPTAPIAPVTPVETAPVPTAPVATTPTAPAPTAPVATTPTAPAPTAPVATTPTTTTAPITPVETAPVATTPTAPVSPVETAPTTTAPTAPVTPVETAPVATTPTTTTAPITPVETAPVATTPTTPTAPVTPVETAPVATAPTTPVATAPTTPVATTPTAPTTPVETAPTTTAPTTPVSTTPTAPVTPVETAPAPTAPTAPGPAPVYDYSTPYTGDYSNESVLSRYLNGSITYGNILALVAAGMVAPTILSLLGVQQPTTPAKKGYGPLAPIQWGTLEGGLTNPGLNPGYLTFGGQPPAFYQTTNPVQSQYYWGMHPYMRTMSDLVNYNQIPEAPAQPFGIQQPIGAFDVNQFIAKTIGTPQYQQATTGSSAQYPAIYAPATSYAGSPTASTGSQPTTAVAQVPNLSGTYTTQNLNNYLPQIPTVPQVNMSFTPVVAQPLNTLPAWAPGTTDINTPVAPYVPYVPTGTSA